MHIPSIFLGACFASLGAAVGCALLFVMLRDDSLRFYAVFAGVACLALALGTGFAAALGYREIL